ncbi:MAG: hypothetical protein A3C70_00400 [Candidatus Zambryskibacteria bacterium RIFCSPHIGHO2_02_FULL_43_14]|uniref:DUF1573 domain-containing protein n=1 Tax=Candidatus Zambryskibacteria bacterium RIFCSPHIGHO2_02_FULL_43_14 TaxID=1802748 RepID=A0A1G2TJK2_9BACT|nr:MAG: hypothetical protein A2829_01975 [Candidatus Zambryskibacteria bacterium RIFCSPHIGHO2_01_FULL_43_60]OHA96801.1 MAG: hypothetical protein A3C70_00400 [Candidatus Zambryskibacteria bacterium RIFCSPHIGHO2_02_FULL_43_14]OHB04056.1 MAG: hypothetical protein A3B03_01220 [Candidatus Zambryskibacteria bacterium RIFCSPLOWO2_01_FULL_42_41]
MKSKTIVSILIVILGIAGLVWWGRSAQNRVSANPNSNLSANALQALETLYDFGTISMRNGLVDHVFKVTNSSDKDIYVKKISTSCMCTSAYIESANGKKGPFGMEGMNYVPPANETIKAGESRDIRVVYDPNAHGPAGVGAIDRFIYLTDASGSTLQFEIRAIVTP